MTEPRTSTGGPHDNGHVLAAGVPLERARAGAILVHGRGADARDILGLAQEIDPGDVAYLAPEASEHTWYPYSFLAPIAHNEPGLSSGLRVLDALVARFAAAGIPPERLLLLGFSQGGCLALEYAARHARRFGAIAGLSAGLIGPPGTPRDYTGSFAGTPVLLGCSDSDPHIPRERVVETAAVFRGLGADVDVQLDAHMGHEVTFAELAVVREMLTGLRAG